MPGRAGGDSCERPASKMYRISSKIFKIEKSIDFECRGERPGLQKSSISFEFLLKIDAFSIPAARGSHLPVAPALEIDTFCNDFN